MTTVKLPSTITVEEESEPDPNDPYGDPAKKIITVKFGDYDVARYELVRSVWESDFYFDDVDGNKCWYDPDRFVADKLARLFKLLG